MDRKQLLHFIKLYETRNITKASEELFLSRQSLSGSIGSLERELDVTLFERSKEGLKPTPAGEIFIEFARAEAAYYQEIESLLVSTMHRINQSKSEQHIALGVPTLAVPECLLLDILAFCQERGRNSISVLDINDGSGWRRVRDGSLDIALSRKLPPKSEKNLTHIPVVDANPGFVMHRNHPLTSKDRIRFRSDLRGQTLLYTFSYLSSELELFAKTDRYELRYASGNSTILGHTLSNSDDIALLHAESCETLVQLFPDLVWRPCDDFPQSLEGYLIFKTNSPKEVLNLVKDLAQRIQTFSMQSD